MLVYDCTSAVRTDRLASTRGCIVLGEQEVMGRNATTEAIMFIRRAFPVVGVIVP